MSRSRYVVIHTDHIQHNLSCVRQLAPHASLLAMVKANAYGHGAVTVARALIGVDAFGVATIAEAIELRQAGVQQAIVIMTGFLTANDYQQVIQYQLDVVIHDIFQLEFIKASPVPSGVRFWLKVDTGLHRLGMTTQVFHEVYQHLMSLDIPSEKCIAMTHMACADDRESSMSQQQWNQFQQVTHHIASVKSVANSALVLNQVNMHADWVRIGYMLYGGSPLSGKTAESLGLLPAMSLHSQVLAVKTIRAGESVGYGATWVSQQGTTIAIIAMGYGDGYPRHAPEGTPVLINGRCYPLVGRVSMDLLTVDLGVNTQIKPGDDVVFWGEGLPVDIIAKHCGTIGYELMTQLSQRIERVEMTGNRKGIYELSSCT